MRPLVRLFVAQSTVMCAVFFSPAGQDFEGEAKTQTPKWLDMYYVLGMTVGLGVLLLWIFVCCIGLSWLREKDM